MIKYEWRSSIKRSHSPLLLEDGQQGYMFRSVYGYPEETQNMIIGQGNTKGLKGKDVYSDVLYIDVDEEENINKVQQRLMDLELSFEKYTTGNRGCHFHVPIVPMTGDSVIYSQKAYLKSIGIYDIIDSSIYKESGQFRCVGAIHKKTKRTKELISTFQGDILEITSIKEPPKTTQYEAIDESTEESVQRYFYNLLKHRAPGQRHLHIYILYKSGMMAGVEFQELREDILWWNHNLKNPHTDETIDKKLRSFI